MRNGLKYSSPIGSASNRGISVWTKRLEDVGVDLGGAIKGFRNVVKEGVEAKTIVDKDSKNKDSNGLKGESANKEKDKA